MTATRKPRRSEKVTTSAKAGPVCRFRVTGSDVLAQYDSIASKWGYNDKSKLLRVIMHLLDTTEPGELRVIRVPLPDPELSKLGVAA